MEKNCATCIGSLIDNEVCCHGCDDYSAWKPKDKEEGMQEEHDDAVDEQTRRWLIGTSATDGNLKSLLSRANAATIRAALAEVEGQHGHAGREKAMKAQLRKLLESQGEQVAATATRQERAVALNTGELAAERERQQQVSAEQAERERLIARYHEAVGQIKTANMFAEFARVSELVWIQQMRETKAYKEIGTWESFCESIGYSRQHVEEQLKNLAAFGEKFTQTVSALGVGYRELRQLRQLKYDGESFQVLDDGKTVVIEGESIALGEDAGAEIEAALEKLLEKNKTLRERNTKLERDLKGAVKEETATLNSEINTYKARVKHLEQFEPKGMDETRFAKQFDEIHKHMTSLATCISQLMGMDDLREHPGVMARADGYVEATDSLATQLRERWAEMYLFENK